MSVTTTSDRKVDLARFEVDCALNHMKRAQRALEEALDKETWGSDEWNLQFRRDVERFEDSVRDFKKLAASLGERRFIGMPEDFCTPLGETREKEE